MRVPSQRKRHPMSPCFRFFKLVKRVPQKKREPTHISEMSQPQYAVVPPTTHVHLAGGHVQLLLLLRPEKAETVKSAVVPALKVGDAWFDTEANTYSFACPHCGCLAQVLKSEINCTIFRHGFLQDTNTQIPPHATQADCEQWIRDNKVVGGCGKPFQFDGVHVTPCGYI